MKRHFLDLLAKLLQVRKDRAAGVYRRTRTELQRVQGFKDQLSDYAQEYETQWTQAARAGDTVQNLQSQMDFGRRWRDTAQAQEPERQAWNQKAASATQQALAESKRLKTVLEFQRRQKIKVQQEQERQNAKDLEDLLQARQRLR